MGVIDSIITKGLLPSVLTGGASLIGSVLNAGSQFGTNSSQLDYAKEMYDKQRADALLDWNMQNEYNSPKNQMARFKEAGLNPNLIYGQMSNSPVVRTSSPQSYNPTAPQVDITRPAGMALDAYYDTQLKTTQTDNLKAQAEGIRQENLLKGYKLMQEAARSKYFEDEARVNFNKLLSDAGGSLYDYDVTKPAQTEQIKAQTDLIKANTLSTMSQTRLSDARKAIVEQELQNLRTDNDLKKLEVQLKRWEVNHQDITNIINYGSKLLGMLPGGAIIQNLIPKRIQNTYQTLKRK